MDNLKLKHELLDSGKKKYKGLFYAFLIKNNTAYKFLYNIITGTNGLQDFL